MRAFNQQAATVAVVAAALALAGCGGGGSEPSLFAGLGDHDSLDAATRAAAADGNLVLVDFYTDW